MKNNQPNVSRKKTESLFEIVEWPFQIVDSSASSILDLYLFEQQSSNWFSVEHTGWFEEWNITTAINIFEHRYKRTIDLYANFIASRFFLFHCFLFDFHELRGLKRFFSHICPLVFVGNDYVNNIVIILTLLIHIASASKQ